MRPAVLAVLLFCLCAGAAACGQAETAGVPFVTVSPEDARLLAASAELESRVGHKVSYEVETSLLKEHAPHIYEIISDALETISRGIDQAKLQERERVARNLLVMSALTVVLDDKTRDPFASFDRGSGVLTLHVPSQATYFVSDKAIVATLTAE